MSSLAPSILRAQREAGPLTLDFQPVAAQSLGFLSQQPEWTKERGPDALDTLNHNAFLQ